MLDTHSYDGHLPPLSDFCKSLLSNEDKKERLLELRAKIKNVESLKYFDIIVNDEYTLANYDDKNKMWACDLLYLLSLYQEYFDIDTLEEQLSDIGRGACPQGRVTRLYQIFSTINFTV